MKNVNSIRNFSDLMETIFDARSPQNFSGESAPSAQPPVNIFELEGDFYIEVLAPGVKKEDIKLHVIDNKLSISYEKEETASQSNGKVLRNEFSVKSFKRKFTLGENVSFEGIKASYDQGILKVTIPKKEAVKPSPIEITVN